MKLPEGMNPSSEIVRLIKDKENNHVRRIKTLKSELMNEEKQLVDFERLEEELWENQRRNTRGESVEWLLTGDPEVIEEFDEVLRSREDSQSLYSKEIRSSTQELVGIIHYHPMIIPGWWSQHTYLTSHTPGDAGLIQKTIRIFNSLPFDLS